MFPSILIVDDEPSILKSLGGLLSDEGFEVITASNGYEGLKIIESQSPDLVLLDIWMPGIDGIETLKEIKKGNPHIQVIIITGHGTIETAVKATKLGAFDLIEKPLSIDKVIVAINNALNFRRLEEENRYLRKKMIEKNKITGSSGPIQALKNEVATAAATDHFVLVIGENGTGKELVARTLHQFSPRSDQPLIVVNCAGIADDRMESELFGREKGADVAATTKKRGRFELADNGTIFLDEIGDMSLATQAKILRVLEEQQFQRVGGERVLTVNVRVIAATNKDLEKEIEKGNFREDLFYRLNVIPIRVPTLRERIDDLPVLVETFFDECAKAAKSEPKRMGPKALELLIDYGWPGNVRELKNLIDRLDIMINKSVITVSDLPAPYYSPQKKPHKASEKKLLAMADLGAAMEAFEKEFITKKMVQNNREVDQAARSMNVEPGYLKRRIKKLKLNL